MSAMTVLTATRPLALVLEHHASTGTWQPRRLDLLSPNAALAEVCYIFLESSDWYKKCPLSDRKKVLAPFQAPDLLSDETCTKLNGYCGSKSSFSDVNGKKTLYGLSMWFQILTKKVLRPEEEKTDEGKDYVWYEMTFFTRWDSSKTNQVFCIGAPLEISAALETSPVLPPPQNYELQDPFAMLRPLLDKVLKLCDNSTWRVTKLVRDIELHRDELHEFSRLRDLARHTGHLVEVEQVAIETIEQLLSLQENSFKWVDNLTETYQVQAKEYLMFQLQVMKSLRWRAQSTHDRLAEEINLAYNMLASSDNAVMKSVTLLTMIFLPATFVSALFSTTFFSFTENGLQFSHMFWIYWVIAIPLTILVLFGWWWWLGGSYKVVQGVWMRNQKR